MKKIFAFLLCCSVWAANAQVGTVSGTVRGDDGTALGGVMVQVEGTSSMAVTDPSGRYTATARQGDVLVFSMLGYDEQRITVGVSSVVDAVLTMDATVIDDLVVVGYGVQKKSVVTAAISSVKADDLEMQTPTRMESMLQGKVAGLSIVRNSGQPSDGVKVRIRGVGSATDGGNASNPLYVIDGMQMGAGDGLNQLNPADIESVQVLKDAASAAVYGTRGANGVIIVTTKRGLRGDARVTYDMQYGWQNPWKHRPLLNTYEYQMLMNEAAMNTGGAPTYADADGNPDPNAALFRDDNGNPLSYDTDWQKAVFNKNAPVQNHQISVSGASERVNYYVSLGYFEQEGIVGGNYGRSNFDRLTLRTNTTFSLMDKTGERTLFTKANLGIQAQYAHTNDTGVTTNSMSGGALMKAIMMPPNQPVFFETETMINNYLMAAESFEPGIPTLSDEKGRYFNNFEIGEIRNPITDMYMPATKNWGDKFFASFWADMELFKGLTFKSSYGVDMAFWGNNRYSLPYFRSSTSNSRDSSAGAEFNRGFTWQWENTLTYQESFGKHNLTVLLGQSARANRNSSRLNGSKEDLIALYPDRAYIDFTTALMGDVSGGPVEPYRLASYFGRLSYNFDERYMLEFTLRRDGSSRFGENNKWGVFPSISAGWNITNEAFAQNFPRWISDLKLRASWGQNGNDNIGNFQYTSNMSYDNLNKYLWGWERTLDIYQVGAVPGRLANPDLKWEKSEQIDIGLDASLFGGALNLSFDWYQKKTKGMLIGMQAPQYVGNTLPSANAGDMTNSGVEFEIDYRFVRGKWSFGASGNLTYLKNTYDNLGNIDGFSNVGGYDDQWGPGTFRRDENGLPFHHFWGKRTDGIFQTVDEINSYIWHGTRPDPNNPGQTITKDWLIQPNAVPGDVKFRDLDGDGQITDADKTMIGNYFPKWTYNITLDAAWNGIDVSMFWQGVADVDIYDYTRRFDRAGGNLPAHYLERWTGPGSTNSMPRMTPTDTANGNWTSSDLYVQNGAYLRLRSLQVGYTIPEWITKKALVSRLRVYFMAENLLTITKYRGFDPEVDNGVDVGLYPQARTLSVGVNLAF